MNEMSTYILTSMFPYGFQGKIMRMYLKMYQELLGVCEEKSVKYLFGGMGFHK